MSKHNRERRTVRQAEMAFPRLRKANLYEVTRMRGKGRKRLAGRVWDETPVPTRKKGK